MDKYSRRKILGMSAVSLAGISGCVGNDDTGSENNDPNEQDTEPPDADGDGVPDSRDEYPNDPDLSSKSTKSDSRKLEEDEWRRYSLDFSSTGYLSYDFIVRDGPEIDAIFIEQSEYSYFDDGERYEYKTNLTAMNSAGEEVSGKVPGGSYYLIFDNSERGEAMPPTNLSNDVVTVEFDMEAGQ